MHGIRNESEYRDGKGALGVLLTLSLLLETGVAAGAEIERVQPMQASVHDVGAIEVIGYHLETEEGCEVVTMLDMRPVLREVLGMPQLGATRMRIRPERGGELLFEGIGEDRLRMLCRPEGGMRVDRVIGTEEFAAR